MRRERRDSPSFLRSCRTVIRPLTCPICNAELPAGAALESRWYPFCGERCRNVDLYRWSQGRYAIVEPLLTDEDADVGMVDEPAEE